MCGLSWPAGRVGAASAVVVRAGLGMRRLGWLLLLPVVWVPLIALALALGHSLPWYGWLFGVLFWVMIARRRRAGAVGGEVSDDGARFSPFHRAGGLW